MSLSRNSDTTVSAKHKIMGNRANNETGCRALLARTDDDVFDVVLVSIIENGPRNVTAGDGYETRIVIPCLDRLFLCLSENLLCTRFSKFMDREASPVHSHLINEKKV